MRQLSGRIALPLATLKRLGVETDGIVKAADNKAEAEKRYNNARRAKWFRHVWMTLGKMAGEGERCMLCSGSEAAQVEHFRPKTIFPELAMTWENFLWCCGVCNQAKGNRFPPDTEFSGKFINPIDENVWEFFFLDEFGNLTPRWRKERDDYDPRAFSTWKLMKLDRQVLQECRQKRRIDLIQRVKDTVALYRRRKLSTKDLKARRAAWLAQPFQPDVADYYLNGPGGKERPFRQFLALIPR
jgi:uncharacterized protein (TIGR02646 family)